MPLEPLDTPFDEEFGSVEVEIRDGRVRFHDVKDSHTIYMSEEHFGNLFDKWMIARLKMNQRKTGNDIL